MDYAPGRFRFVCFCFRGWARTAKDISIFRTVDFVEKRRRGGSRRHRPYRPASGGRCAVMAIHRVAAVAFHVVAAMAYVLPTSPLFPHRNIWNSTS